MEKKDFPLQCLCFSYLIKNKKQKRTEKKTNMHLVRILIMLCSVISAAFLVSATVGIAWGKNEGRNGKTYFGLWKVCDGIICHKFN